MTVDDQMSFGSPSLDVVTGVERHLRNHLADTWTAMVAIEPALPAIVRCGRRLADVMQGGGRLLAAGDGGDAAHAQHLTSELVGRFQADRPAYSAISLHGEASALTAILNDYGADEVFARQVEAHGRHGDVLVVLSTSGRSPNVVRAAHTASRLGLSTITMTGPVPNPLAAVCDETLAVEVRSTAAVQEAHQVMVHLLCVAFEASRNVAP